MKFNNKKNYLYVFLLLIFLLGYLDAKNIDDVLYQYFSIGYLNYYDVPIWSVLTVIGTISVSVIALYVSYKSIEIEKKQNEHIDKQLRIEQEPYVVVLNGVNFEGIGGRERDKPNNYLYLHLKNIGRGPAIRVTVTGSARNRNEPLFEDKKEPHSYDLGSGDEKVNWKIDQHRLEMLVKKKHNVKTSQLDNNMPIYFYIYFYDQLKKSYKVRVKLYRSGSGNFLKAMENERL